MNALNDKLELLAMHRKMRLSADKRRARLTDQLKSVTKVIELLDVKIKELDNETNGGVSK